MNVGTIAFLLIIAAIALAAVLLRRRRADGEGEDDTGSALLQFGTSFPDAAVRDVVRTADGKATFLRLADGRTGLVRVDGLRHAMRIIEPRQVDVDGPAGDCGLRLSFRGEEDTAQTFVFTRAQDAAEVSLWLCAGFAAGSAQSISGENDASAR